MPAEHIEPGPAARHKLSNGVPVTDAPANFATETIEPTVEGLLEFDLAKNGSQTATICVDGGDFCVPDFIG